MKLKNHLSYGSWYFILGDGDEEIRVPSEGFLKSRPQLARAVIAMMASLAKQGNTGFLSRAEEESKSMKMNLLRYVETVIEHQICVRMNGDKNWCLPSGYGDRLHSFVAKVDDTMEKAPTVVRKVYQKVAASVTEKLSGKASPRLSSCSSCGGTKKFSGKTWNLGRAGRMR